MTSYLTGGGRAYGLEVNIMKSSSTSTWTSNNSSSPSSTLSESSNSPVFVCSRKPRTQRKRPNQKYNEAAALLSTAYPNIFSSKELRSPTSKFSSTLENGFFDESSELLLPFRAVDKSEFLLHHDTLQDNVRPYSLSEPKLSPLSDKPCQSPGEVEIQSQPMEFFDGYQEEFDADSILDEEIEEGIIDTIMGNLSVDAAANNFTGEPNVMWFGSGFGFDLGFGRGAGVNALRNVDGANNWWDFPFPTVDVFEISSKFGKSQLPNPTEKKKKNVEKPLKPKEEEPKNVSGPVEEIPSTAAPSQGQKLELLLKLNYDGILTAWSDRGSPFSDDITGSDVQGSDVSARLAQIDLFSEAGGVRESRVQRYKEKRRTRLFSKKIRYEVRKVNADQRPRMKGRFVRQSSPSSNRNKKRSKLVRSNNQAVHH